MGRLEFPTESLDALRRLRGKVTELLSGGVSGGGVGFRECPSTLINGMQEYQ